MRVRVTASNPEDAVAADWISIDLTKSAERMDRDVETLGGPDFTSSTEAICRYSYIPEFQAATDYFKRELEAVEFEAWEDPVGNLIARNRPRGKPAFALGSHHDSNRNGGKYDGTLGVVVALEVCRLSNELGLDLPLQLMSFIEEEASGFGQGVLGSRIIAGQVSEEDLRENLRATDDGRSFWEHAEGAGHDPSRWRECGEALEGLTGWIELHIEQGLVLQEGKMPFGIVNAIVGVNWVELVFHGRADHAGGTAMPNRADAGIAAAETVVELERLVNEQTVPTVGTAGIGQFLPGLYNVIPGEARLGLDIRSVEAGVYERVIAEISAFARERGATRNVTVDVSTNPLTVATAMDDAVVDALTAAGEEGGHHFTLMHSGGGHDTQIVAPHVPSAMVFVPCKDGISHSPDEDADTDDAAVAVEVMLNAVSRYTTS
jgi:hydantoinase/carbamoylase family amidase